MNMSLDDLRPDDISPAHWYEWVVGSGVHPDIVAANVQSLSDLEIDPYTHDIETPIHERLNWQYTRFGYQAKANLRGWWVAGLDPLNDWSSMKWGRFKPDSETPILDRQKNEAAKYLSPKGVESRATFLRVSRELWGRVSDRAGVPITDPDSRLWEWVQRTTSVPVFATEGEKKAGALLTAGYAAIALPGITMGVRTKDKSGLSSIPRLIEELKVFAQPGREFVIVFDHETKAKTIRAVEREIEKLKAQLTKLGCTVKIVVLPGPEKGVDDFIVAHGAEAFHALYQSALTFEQWQAHRLSRLTIPADVELNQRYLGELELPADHKLIAIRSPKGTGKTHSFKAIVADAMMVGQRTLMLTHRVQLGEATCERVGLPYISETRSSQEGTLLGYGACVDSLHAESQTRFNPDEWNDAIVIMDESEQVIWHLLASTTEISNRRFSVLGNLKRTLMNILESDRGKIILSDADLSDLSFEFVWGLMEERVKPWIILNHYRFEEPWLITNFNQTSPVQCLAALDRELDSGGKPLILTHSQREKSRYSTTNLERMILARYPDKRVLRIDSVTVSDPSHPAYGCTGKLNDIVTEYDVVIASPVIETGVSIDVRGHFTSVWGFFHGVTPENSTRQFLARLREAVPRYVWLAKYGIGKTANGSTSVRAILKAEYQMAQVSSRLIQLISFDDDLISAYSSALKIWAKMAARINAGMITYRESVLSALRGEGHIVVNGSHDDNTEELLSALDAAKDESKRLHYEATSAADDITAKEYDELRKRKAKTAEERNKERKHAIAQRYQVEVTPDLVAKDDDGWYPKLRLFYFLNMGRPFVQERDRQSLEAITQAGGPWLPTLNRAQYSIKVFLLEKLGLQKLLDLDSDFNGGLKKNEYADAHSHLLNLSALAKKNAWIIKNALGITVSESMSPIQVAQTLLGKIGIKLKCDRQEGPKGARQRIYRYELPKDGRDAILQGWFTRDQLTRNNSEMHTPGIDISIPTRSTGETYVAV